MTDKTKIVFATDFSKTTRKLTELIKFLQTKIDLDVSFIHVIPSRWKEFFSSGTCKKAALQRLGIWQEETTQSSDHNHLHVEYGNAADAIANLANQVEADLILIGAKNLENHGRYKTGATVDSVVRHSRQSVLVCKSGSIEKVLCGIDGSDNSAAALNEAIKICQLFSATLKIVYVLPRIDFNPLGLDENEMKNEEDKFKQIKIDETDQFLKQFNFDDIHVDKHFLWGEPASVILDMAEDFSQDLIVVGAKGHSFLHHVLIGSTTEKILRHAPCSLLVVR